MDFNNTNLMLDTCQVSTFIIREQSLSRVFQLSDICLYVLLA